MRKFCRSVFVLCGGDSESAATADFGRKQRPVFVVGGGKDSAAAEGVLGGGGGFLSWVVAAAADLWVVVVAAPPWTMLSLRANLASSGQNISATFF
jgi:hypothetical protein